jgi:hypothetical protein
MRTAARWAGLLGLELVLLAAAGWGVLALAYFDHLPAGLRTALAASFALASLVTVVAVTRSAWRGRALAGYLVLLAVLGWSWSAIAPSNDRDWKPETARLASATIAGRQVTLHNIRNFDYRTETDFTPAYYDRTFDLDQLDSMDLVAAYWMGPAIAHIFLSFGFHGQQVAISIEARAERTEGYSSVKGFFRQYELVYVVADERDVIRVRTNYRRDPPEDVYLYRLPGEPARARRLFLEYVAEINRLVERPEFYNTLTTNCTGSIWLHSRVLPGHLPFSREILLSGYLPDLRYRSGRLDGRLPFADLERRSRINDRARAADRAEDFSRRIRVGLPGMTGPPGP